MVLSEIVHSNGKERAKILAYPLPFHFSVDSVITKTKELLQTIEFAGSGGVIMDGKKNFKLVDFYKVDLEEEPDSIATIKKVMEEIYDDLTDLLRESIGINEIVQFEHFCIDVGKSLETDWISGSKSEDGRIKWSMVTSFGEAGVNYAPTAEPGRYEGYQMTPEAIVAVRADDGVAYRFTGGEGVWHGIIIDFV